MKHVYVLFTLLFVGTLSYAQDCSTGRYMQPVFTQIDSVIDVKYGENTAATSSNIEELFMDIYYPTNDPSSSRALMILAHGGSFIGGDKGKLRNQCINFAKLGYVVATINYRLLSITPAVIANPGPEFKKEVIRAVHDMKAAVRYFRKSEVNGNPYKINPNLIIVGGYSAGAITSNHLAYLDQESEIPADLQPFFDATGGLEGTSGNQGYSSVAQIDVSLCGAINDTTWMKTGSIPYVGVHTDGDPVVPNLYGQPNIGMVIPVDLYGDSLMYKRALNVGMTANYQMYVSPDHCDFPEPGASLFVITFLHDQICNNSLSTSQQQDFQFRMYPNPTQNHLVIQFKDQGVHSIVQILTANGALVSTSILDDNENQINMNVSSLNAGTYFIRIVNGKGQVSTQKFIKR